MWVDMLMIDINATIMQATIYANRLPRFQSKLADGKMFSLSGFDLTDPVSPLPNSLRNAIAELGRLLMYEASREWLVRPDRDRYTVSVKTHAFGTSWRYALVQLEGLSPYRFCKSHHTRDVKSANILLDENFMAKVLELGLPKTGPYLDQTHVSLTVKGSFGYLLDQLVKKAKIEEIIDHFLDWKVKLEEIRLYLVYTSGRSERR
ncbi:hypothetical protein HID58_047204 [Brassica napus]|uniref:Uncharacterized protein n=1 Tax=Brassica napus TaxID=3708 RepID=A0ABQ8B023_BRANA|nr:hypothetical protein HID58_047204 [Brassica napus]